MARIGSRQHKGNRFKRRLSPVLARLLTTAILSGGQVRCQSVLAREGDTLIDLL